jgi:hypothetical protein
VAAFAKENRLARILGTRTGGQVLGGANFALGHGFVLRSLQRVGIHRAAASSRGVVCTPMSTFRRQPSDFATARTISSTLQ